MRGSPGATSGSRKTANRALLLFFGLALAAVLGEVLVRFAGAAQPAMLGPLFDRPTTYYRPHPERRHPGSSEGERLRIAVVGDSFTVGQANQWDDAYPARLERLLNLNQDVLPAEVHVFARNGSSTADQLGFLRLGLRIKPQLLILGLFINDTEDYKSGDLEQVREGLGPHLPQGWRLAVLRHSHLARLAFHKWEEARRWRAAKDYYERIYDPEYSGWARFNEGLDEFKRLTSRRKVRFVAVIFPVMAALEESEYPFMFAHERLHGALEDRAIPYLDLLGSYFGTSPLRMAAHPEVDGHPSEIGHRIAAEAIFEYLLDTGMIDASYLPELRVEIPRERSLDALRDRKTPVGASRKPAAGPKPRG